MMLRGCMELHSHRGNAPGKASSLVMQSLSLVVVSPAAHLLPMPNFSRKAAKEEGLLEMGCVPVVTVETSCSARVPVGSVSGHSWKKAIAEMLRKRSGTSERERGVFHDRVVNEPKSVVMKVSEGYLPDMNGAEGDAATQVPSGRLLKGTLEGSSQDGVGIRQPSAPAGLPSSSCTRSGMVEGVGKGGGPGDAECVQ